MVVGGKEAKSLVGAQRKWEVKLGYFRGMYSGLGGPRGVPMVTDGRCLRPGHRWGRWRQEIDLYHDLRPALPIFTHETTG